MEWHSWLAYIDNCATFYGVKNYMDVAIAEDQMQVVTEPANSIDDPTQEVNANIFNRYKLALDRYIRINNGLMPIDTLIMKSVTNEMRLQIQKNRTVHQKMHYLQRYYKPTAVEWRQVLTQRIAEISTPDPEEDLIKWSDGWLALADEVTEAGLPGVNRITLRDSFLQAASTLDYALTVTHSHVPESDPNGGTHTLESVLRTWHLLRRAPHNQTNSTNHSAATFNTTSNNPQNIPLNHGNRPQQRPFMARPSNRQDNQRDIPSRMSPCACGLQHRFADCFYIVESKRPPTWQPREHIMRRVKTWLREPSNKRQVETTFSRQRIESALLQQTTDLTRRNPNTHSVMMNTTTTDEQPDPFPFGNDLHACWQLTTCLSSTHTETKNEDTYPLKHSFIFDTGADMHIANNIDSFITPIRPAPETHKLYSGDSISTIKGYGDAMVNITDINTEEQKKIILKNTAYVPSLHTNIISGYRCKQIGIFC